MSVLEVTIAEDLIPLKVGGLTLYPAAALPRIFDWADRTGRTVDWIEGVFYSPVDDKGQLSLDYICGPREGDDVLFRQTCLRMAEDIGADAAKRGMGAYFEVGISD